MTARRAASVLGSALLIAGAPRATLGAQASPASQRAAATAEAIRVARATFQEAERAVAQRRWVRQDTTVRCEGDDSGMEVVFHRDSQQVVRRFDWSGGTDDHAEHHRYFYDASGRLRFAFTTIGAVNGTEREERVYYGDTGQAVRRLTRLVRGPGYPVDKEAGVFDPLAWLRRSCE